MSVQTTERAQSQLMIATRRLERSRAVLSTLWQVESTIDEVEIAERSLLFTGDRAYIASGSAAWRRFQSCSKELAGLTADDVSQRLRVSDLEARVERIPENYEDDPFVRRGRRRGLARIARMRRGAAEMVRIRSVLGAIRSAGKSAEIECVEEWRGCAERAEQVILRVSILTGALLAALMLVLRLDLAARAQSEKLRRWRVGEVLRLSEARLDCILDAITDAFITLDADLRVSYVNGVAVRLLCQPRDALAGRLLHDVLPPPVSGEMAEECRRAIEHQVAVGLERYWPSHDAWYEVRLYPSLDGVTIYLHDISRRKRAADALQRAHDELEHRVAVRTADLARSNAALEQFAYIASHDLQEPLFTISTLTQILEGRLRDKLDVRTAEFLRHIVGSAARMQALINDLLAYSRIGTHGRRFEVVEAGRCLRDAVKNLHSRIDETNAELVDDELPQVFGDATQLTQVFQNLIANAIRYKGDRRPRIAIRAERQGQHIVFSVRDNGSGIAPEHFDRVFGVFERFHAGSDGTGIGLALCKKIVERHGGRIWVNASSDAGTTMCFSIPGAEAARSDEEVDGGSAAKATGAFREL